ncbi:MAG: MaoC family dehydratase N-terminal domain-containing protein [Deltaproteobacteria bacterium]
MGDLSKLGFVFPPYTFLVEKGKIAEFTRAVFQKENSQPVDCLYTNTEIAKAEGFKDIIVPPTFQTCCALWAGGGIMEIVGTLGINLMRLLHGEEAYEYFAPIYAGDALTSLTKVVEIYQKKKKDKPGKFMDFTVLETEIKNQNGELVIKSRTTLVER